MIRLITPILLVLFTGATYAQELYVFSEPASNVPAKSIGLRLTTMHMPMSFESRQATRIMPEVMLGINKNWMVTGSLYAANMLQPSWNMEGGGLYAKYRFLSVDQVHAHFRMAAFGKVSLVNNSIAMFTEERHVRPDGSIHIGQKIHRNDDLTLNGNHSGWTAGIVATQLFHKLAISGTGAIIQRMDNVGKDQNFNDFFTRQAFSYSLSAGYLLLPVKYKSYDQTNLNLYVEFLGGEGLDRNGGFIDIAPAIQLIFKSTAKLNLGYRKQLNGSVARWNTEGWQLSFEYSLFNVLK